MIEQRYLCTGGCGANFTRDEYDTLGEKKCQDKSCANHGQPFVLRRWCTVCKTHLEPGAPTHHHQ